MPNLVLDQEVTIMKIHGLVPVGATATLAALLISPALGQSYVQRVTVIQTGAGQSIQIRPGQRQLPPIATADYGQRRETRLSIRAASLNQPYHLNVQSSGAALTGVIKLNGKSISQLEGSSSTLNLSPHLSVGNHVIEIAGHYTPAQASASVSLVGPGLSFSSQVSGQGSLTNRIQLSVR